MSTTRRTDGPTQDDRVLAQQLHSSRGDAQEWEEAPAEVRVKPSRSEVISFRVPSDLLDELEQAAGAQHVSVSGYIRKALVTYMRGSGTEALAMDALVDVHYGLHHRGPSGMSGPSGLTVRTALRSPGRTENSAEIERVPDYPPSSVADVQ